MFTILEKYKDNLNILNTTVLKVAHHGSKTSSTKEFLEVAYLGLWKKINNVFFKGHEFTTFENEAGKNSFYMLPQRWIKETNAVGTISKSGNNGGTYAHPDIAFEFASWLSPEFKLYLITEFEILKNDSRVKKLKNFQNEINNKKFLD